MKPAPAKPVGVAQWLQPKPPPHLDRRLCYLFDQKVLYVVIPKTGCTTINTVLATAAGLIDPVQRSSGVVHQIWTETDKRWSKYGLRLREAALRGAAVFRVTSVRNPYERAVSCYLDKVVAHPEYWREQAKSQVTTFRDFLIELRDMPLLSRDVHARAMVDLCFPDEINYKLVIRYEHFERDVLRLARRLGVEELGVPIPAQQTNARDKMGELIGRTEARLIREIYARDFDAFGYSLDVPTD